MNDKRTRAAEIKARRMQEIREILPQWAKEAGVSEEEAQAVVEKALRLAEGQTADWWWIDRERYPLEQLLESLDDAARTGHGRGGKPAPKEDWLF